MRHTSCSIQNARLMPKYENLNYLTVDEIENYCFEA